MTVLELMELVNNANELHDELMNKLKRKEENNMLLIELTWARAAATANVIQKLLDFVKGLEIG